MSPYRCTSSWDPTNYRSCFSMLRLLSSTLFEMQRLHNPRTIAIVGAGIGIAAYTTSHYLRNLERLDDGSLKRIFTGQLGFQSLTLESVEQVNHNVKRLRFALPDKDAVSGLTLNCTPYAPPCPNPSSPALYLS